MTTRSNNIVIVPNDTPTEQDSHKNSPNGHVSNVKQIFLNEITNVQSTGGQVEELHYQQAKLQTRPIFRPVQCSYQTNTSLINSNSYRFTGHHKNYVPATASHHSCYIQNQNHFNFKGCPNYTTTNEYPLHHSGQPYIFTEHYQNAPRDLTINNTLQQCCSNLLTENQLNTNAYNSSTLMHNTNSNFYPNNTALHYKMANPTPQYHNYQNTYNNGIGYNVVPASHNTSCFNSCSWDHNCLQTVCDENQLNEGRQQLHPESRPFNNNNIIIDRQTIITPSTCVSYQQNITTVYNKLQSKKYQYSSEQPKMSTVVDIQNKSKQDLLHASLETKTRDTETEVHQKEIVKEKDNPPYILKRCNGNLKTRNTMEKMPKKSLKAFVNQTKNDDKQEHRKTELNRLTKQIPQKEKKYNKNAQSRDIFNIENNAENSDFIQNTAILNLNPKVTKKIIPKEHLKTSTKYQLTENNKKCTKLSVATKRNQINCKRPTLPKLNDTRQQCSKGFSITNISSKVDEKKERIKRKKQQKPPRNLDVKKIAPNKVVRNEFKCQIDEGKCSLLEEKTCTISKCSVNKQDVTTFENSNSIDKKTTPNNEVRKEFKCQIDNGKFCLNHKNTSIISKCSSKKKDILKENRETRLKSVVMVPKKIKLNSHCLGKKESFHKNKFYIIKNKDKPKTIYVNTIVSNDKSEDEPQNKTYIKNRNVESKHDDLIVAQDGTNLNEHKDALSRKLKLKNKAKRECSEESCVPQKIKKIEININIIRSDSNNANEDLLTDRDLMFLDEINIEEIAECLKNNKNKTHQEDSSCNDTNLTITQIQPITCLSETIASTKPAHIKQTGDFNDENDLQEVSKETLNKSVENIITEQSASPDCQKIEIVKSEKNPHTSISLKEALKTKTEITASSYSEVIATCSNYNISDKKNYKTYHSIKDELLDKPLKDAKFSNTPQRYDSHSKKKCIEQPATPLQKNKRRPKIHDPKKAAVMHKNRQKDFLNLVPKTSIEPMNKNIKSNKIKRIATDHKCDISVNNTEIIKTPEKENCDISKPTSDRIESEQQINIYKNVEVAIQKMFEGEQINEKKHIELSTNKCTGNLHKTELVINTTTKISEEDLTKPTMERFIDINNKDNITVCSENKAISKCEDEQKQETVNSNQEKLTKSIELFSGIPKTIQNNEPRKKAELEKYDEIVNNGNNICLVKPHVRFNTETLKGTKSENEPYQKLPASVIDLTNEDFMPNSENMKPAVLNTEPFSNNELPTVIDLTDDNSSLISNNINSDVKRINAVNIIKTVKFIEDDEQAMNVGKLIPVDDNLQLSLTTQVTTLLGCRLKINGIIHRGSFSDIFQCQRPDGKLIAAKCLRKEITPIALGKQMTKILCKIQLDIPRENYYCVYVINSLIVVDRWCLLMDYYPKNLEDVLCESGKSIHVNLLKDLSRQLISAVTVLRNSNIIHSDIKPSHILMNAAKNQLKLCGFDEMYKLSDMSFRPNIGSIHYRAPEIIMGYTAGHSIDVWSTAVVMHEMATKSKLFKGTNNNEVLYQQMCTLGPLPDAMVNASIFRHCHYRNTTFLRQNQHQPNNKNEPIHNFSKSARMTTSIFEAYFRDWSQDRDNQQRTGDLAKLRQFSHLLQQMMVLEPSQRLTVEFAYADPFIYK